MHSQVLKCYQNKKQRRLTSFITIELYLQKCYKGKASRLEYFFKSNLWFRVWLRPRNRKLQAVLRE